MKHKLYREHKRCLKASLAILLLWVAGPLGVLAQGTAVYRLNAGGPAVRNALGAFAADAHFAGGSAFSTGAAVAGTANGAMYQTERFGAFGYALPVSNGTYTVVLHFAELYWTRAGQRVFDVAAEGTKVLTRYDIAKKVGPLAATSETFAVAVADGVLNLDFSALPAAGGVDQAKVSAIEVLVPAAGNQAPVAYAGAGQSVTLPTSSAALAGAGTDADGTVSAYAWAQTGGPAAAAFSSKAVAAPTVSGLVAGNYVFSLVVTDNQGLASAASTVAVAVNPATTGAVAYRLNAGGPAVRNALGAFAADAHFAGGSAFSTGAAVAGTANGAMYQTERFGAFGYALPVSNGTYTVVLHFAELYWTRAGQRVFDVAAEGTKVLTRYDIAKKVGPLAATSETFAVAVADGVLNLDFSALPAAGGVDQAKVSAIEVLAATTCQGTATPTVTAPLAYCTGAAADLLSSSVAVAPGATPVFYAAATGGTALAAGFRPPTTAAGSIAYYASQLINGCESTRVPIVVNVTNGPAAPGVTTPVTYCLGAASNLLSASVALTGGAALRLYASTTSTTPLADFRPSTATSGSTTYYAAQALGSCESTRSPVVVTITNGTAPPAVASPLAYCVGTAPALLSAGVALASGATLRLYASATGTAPLADFAPSTATAGSTTYYASQVLNGCESGRVAVVVSVTAGPGAPATVSPVGYCLGDQAALLSAGVTLASGAVLRLYANASGGTPLADFIPSTATAGTATYYAAQVLNGCESGRAPLAVAVTSGPAKPGVTTPLTYCQGAASSPLSAGVALAPGGLLRLYSAASGGTAIADFAPSTAALGSTTYYATQAAGSCESGRTPLVISVISGPAAPTVGSPLTYCQGAASALLSSSLTLASGATLRLYASATSTVLLADFNPPTAIVGSTNYYASQVLNGCESSRVPIAVNVTGGPAAPAVTAPLAYCQGTQSALLSGSVTLASGAALHLYASATSTALMADFAPPTTTVGSATYYAAQALNGCESGRVAVVVNVTGGPAAPVTAGPLAYCQGAQAALLSSGVTLTSGATLLLYASASGGTAIADFAPSTAAAGSTTYYASQVLNGCESGRTAVVVSVTAGPAAPVVMSPLPYCVGAASALLSSSVTLTSGATLRLYTNSTSTAPVNDFAPVTAAIGSTTYYASQVLNGCESSWAAIVINVTGGPAAPAVTAPLPYCVGAASALLSSSVTLASGATLRLYADASSSAALTDFTPSTAAIGSTTYYASQVLNGCESGRVAVVINVTGGPAAPAVTAPLAYCQGAQAALLSSGVTLTSGATLLLYASASGGTAIADFAPSTAAAGSTTYYASQVLNGCESGRTAVVVSVASATNALALVPPAGVDARNIAAWGDSFTDANYGLYPQVLAQLTGGTIYNGGIGGQTSVQIRDRLVAATAKYSWPVIIWAGRNDSDKPDQVKASIATMVATLGHSNYLIVSLCNGEGEGIGTYAYGLIKPLNNDLAAIYGNHFLDVRAFLVAHYDPNQPQDAADYAADVPPASLRQDFLHPNRVGSTLIANYIYANMNLLMSATYCQGAVAQPLSSGVALAAGASLRVYSSLTAATAANDFAPATAAVGSTTYYVTQAVGGCESPRTPLTLNVINCAGGGTGGVAGGATSGSGSAAKKAALQPAAAADPVLEAYPNPFASEATIDFALATTQAYSLELYDSKGTLAQRVASGTAQGGTRYQFKVSSRDLAEGIYLVRLVAGKDSKLFKLTMAR